MVLFWQDKQDVRDHSARSCSSDENLAVFQTIQQHVTYWVYEFKKANHWNLWAMYDPTSKSAPAPSYRLNIDFFYALLRVIKSSNGRVEVEKRLLFKWSLRLIELYTAFIVTQWSTGFSRYCFIETKSMIFLLASILCVLASLRDIFLYLSPSRKDVIVMLNISSQDCYLVASSACF